MKKVFSLYLLLLICFHCFANEWKVQSSVSLQESFINKQTVTPTEDENHFAKISGVGVPVPYGQLFVQYTIPLDFGNSIIFQGANISFFAGPILTPITFDNQTGIIFSPSPVLNIAFGGTIGTGWDLLGNHGIAKYDDILGSYKTCSSFVDWKYSLFGQCNFQFDFGAIFPGEWTHVLAAANYTISYEGCTATEKYEPWIWQGQENVNGFIYSASCVLGYMLPWKMNMIAFSANWFGHLNGEDFGIYNKPYNGDFVEMTLAAQIAFELSKKSQLAVVAEVPSYRGFSEVCKTDDARITKTTAGREWCFSGITIQWVYEF